MALPERKINGFLRWFMRAPILLFHLRLGWLFFGHFLMVTTKGRRSGLPRYAVVEIIQREEPDGTCVVVSGWGTRSDWYRNICQDPIVTVDIGARRFSARAEVIEKVQASKLLLDYGNRYPIIFEKMVKSLTGEQVKCTLEECTRLVELAPLVRFIPEQAG